MMAHERPQAVAVTLDKERFLFYDFESSKALFGKYKTIRFAQELYERSGEEYELKSMEALAFFLWAGLQAEAREHGESLTETRVQEMVTPVNAPMILVAVIISLSGIHRQMVGEVRPSNQKDPVKRAALKRVVEHVGRRKRTVSPTPIRVTKKRAKK